MSIGGDLVVFLFICLHVLLLVHRNTVTVYALILDESLY